MTQQNLESKKIRNIRRNSGDDSMKEDIRQTSSSTTTTTTTKQSSSSSTTKAISNRNIPHESEMVYTMRSLSQIVLLAKLKHLFKNELLFENLKLLKK